MFTSIAKNCRNKTDQLTYLLTKTTHPFIHHYIHICMHRYIHTHTHTHKIHIPWIQNLGKAKLSCEICHTYSKYKIQEHIQLAADNRIMSCC